MKLCVSIDLLHFVPKILYKKPTSKLKSQIGFSCVLEYSSIIELCRCGFQTLFFLAFDLFVCTEVFSVSFLYGTVDVNDWTWQWHTLFSISTGIEYGDVLSRQNTNLIVLWIFSITLFFATALIKSMAFKFNLAHTKSQRWMKRERKKKQNRNDK